jgi:hypothetical protein
MSNTHSINPNGIPGPNAPTFYAGTAQTTGNATANINVLIPLPVSNSSMSLRAHLTGYDKTSNLCVGGELIASVRNTAGAITIIANEDLTRNNDNAVSDFNVDLVNTGTNIQVRVTGTGKAPGSDVINWTAIIDTVVATAAQA